MKKTSAKSLSNLLISRRNLWASLPAVFCFGLSGLYTTASAQELANSCPVDGCKVEFAELVKEGDQLRITFDSNFKPDLSKNHLHVWWGENFEITQVSANAESDFGVTQGVWHPTDEYPSYLTAGPTSLSERGEAVTLCVTASDRDHNILDPEELHCVSVQDHLD